MHITLAAAAAVPDYGPRSRQHQVGQRLVRFFIEDHRAGRHTHHEVTALMAVLLLAAARFAVARNKARLVLKVEQGRKSFVDLEDHVAAAAPVATRGTAERAEFLAQKR